MNFLNHLEDWTDQATQRSESVVVAKVNNLSFKVKLNLVLILHILLK